jgi:hypothetical protein
LCGCRKAKRFFIPKSTGDVKVKEKSGMRPEPLWVPGSPALNVKQGAAGNAGACG